MSAINPIGNPTPTTNFRGKVTITSPNLINAYKASTLNLSIDEFAKVQKQEVKKQKEIISEACQTLFNYIGKLGTNIISNK